MNHQIEPIIIEAEIPSKVDDVFKWFTSGFSKWWPREYTWSQEKLVTIGIEMKVGGRCTELGPNNFQIDWGRVTAFDSLNKVELAWQISPSRVPQPDPDNASRVTVIFEPIETNLTKVKLHHDRFENHGEGCKEYRDALGSDFGWPYILSKFKEACVA